MLQFGVNRRMENAEEGQDIMTTPYFLTEPEGAANRRRDAEPIEEPVLTDAEEEEIAELWVGDPGNQGA
jgi:hypothetical protein